MFTGYVVEKCEEGVGQHWEKVPGHVTGTSHVVRDLNPGKKYKFRVKAENIYGVSEPVETDKSVLAKNPYGKYKFQELCHNQLRGWLLFTLRCTNTDYWIRAIVCTMNYIFIHLLLGCLCGELFVVNRSSIRTKGHQY